MTSVFDTLNVSRETYARLDVYEDLLRKWNPKINLVSKSTLIDMRTRHFEDSAQIMSLARDDAETWVDLGSGGGFPGLIVAILAHELRPHLSVTMIESDKRKCTFLRTVARETGVTVHVIADRIEAAPEQSSDIVSARALTDLSGLLSFGLRHMSPDGECIFLKGANWKKEVEFAQATWSFSMEQGKSCTEADSVILKIKDIKND